MINDELISYVKQQLALKVSREVIVANLKGSGWTDMDINEAFRVIMPLSAPALTPAVPVAPTITPNITQTQSAQSVFSPISRIQTGQPMDLQPVHKSKKIIPIIVILILLGLVGGIAAYAYYSGAFVKLPSLVSQAIDSARVVTSGSYDTTVSIDFSQIKSMTSSISQLFSPGVASNKFTVTTTGSYDSSDKKNIKSSVLLSVDSGTLSFGAELRVLGGTLYGQLTKVPTIAFLGMLTTYKNKWFSVPFKARDSQVINNLISSISGINSSVTDKITSEQRNHLYQMIKNAHFIKQTAKLSSETIGGESSYHFAFDLDRAGISAYLQSLKEYINTISKDDSALSAFNPTSITKELDNLKDFKGEIWIGRNDKLIHKIVINFGIQPDLTKDEQVKINTVAIFGDYNQPVLITAPAKSTPFETLISGMMSGSVIDRKPKAK